MTKGQAAAGILLPPLPDDLRRQEAHAPVVEGEPVIAILARERQALDRANARQGRTIQFYDDLTSRYGTPTLQGILRFVSRLAQSEKLKFYP
ncbi:hypothetical protein ELH88_05070 [Rhizobium ruizarguesonis]|nr:hypothetical protein ELI34_05200 [Rhizobium ruizarguesonis]TAV30780.1 hypothetical protein ELI35_06515 [Rhizobium ruizarguesonis]TAW75290.1 hypothetical protein ELI16_04860 [Rhizobium ruizarguesonis]TAW96343.1 hypothetical protein ELI11_05290 [Rhizobium ruizarguesonis]TAY49589.1 hypothetical protein ELH87_05060 [Rhizobium ruizarguesonis]